MGVNGLWTVVQPCARPTNLATLNRKRLAVDASIWIYQFLKAVRDKEGNALRNSHVVGFFRRICKLLWFGIKPVFVFDGGAPALKRQTIQGRKQRREGRREDAVRTAGKLLAVQMQRIAEEEGERRKRDADRGIQREREEPQEEIPDADNIVYVDEVGMSRQERQQTRKFFKQDAYHLPELDGDIASMAKADDPRVMSIEELEEYARQFHNGEDINLYDFSKIDFDGEFFQSLPAADRYNILNAARLRSRLRMGLSKEQLDDMFPDRMAFSRFQIERVRERNNLTQRLMKEAGMTGLDLTLTGGGRIAGERDREYILVKNDGAEGGWALGVVSKEKDLGEAHKPIDVDALDFQFQQKDKVEESDEGDFEDVPVEGLNRLPKISSREVALRRQQLYGSQGGGEGEVEVDNLFEEEEEQSLFVGGDVPKAHDRRKHSGDEAAHPDEEDDINRAIAMSLQNQHSKDIENSEEDEQFEDVEMEAPTWKQKAVEGPRPIAVTSGRMVAHIVNNRSTAAVPKRRANSVSSSDDEMDLQAALKASRQKKRALPKPAVPNIKNPFDGPLPFPKLAWGSSLFSMKAPSKKPEGTSTTKQPTPNTQKSGLNNGDAEFGGGFIAEDSVEEPVAAAADDDDDEGGFEKGPQEERPKPLPPWMVDNTDIRESIKQQRQVESEINTEDREAAIEEERRLERQRQNQLIEIQSSDDEGSDIEILEIPPSPKQVSTQEETAFADGAISNDATPSAQIGSLEKKESAAASLEKSDATSRKPPPSPEPDFGEVWPENADEDMGATITQVPDSPEPEMEDITVDAEQQKPDSPDLAMQDASIDAEQTKLAQEEQELTFEELMGGPQSDNPNTVGDPVQDAEAAVFAESDDEFSDPEDEELFANLAQEAEEHARFASELNNKSEYENKEAYERELKALRTQQKKDRRDADEVTQVMVTECQALLRLFGIPYITAPMEAEAQCAELVQLGLVDGIVTDDSDCFLFGGTRIYKNMFNSNKFVECYLSSDLEKELSLSREQLIAIAQLLGSDYTEGLPGVGPVTAVEILSEFPGKDGLDRFKEWWQDVQMNNRPKEADAVSPFRRKFRKSQATKLFLPSGFPNPAVTDAYIRPEVDSSPEHFQWGVPDLEGLRQFLMATIGWSKERTDEVLVPVIRDMNKRDMEGTQTNITRYFEGTVGVGARDAFAPRQKGATSKRMADAVSRLRANTNGEQTTVAGLEDVSASAKVTRKRKTRARTAAVEEEEDEFVDDAEEERSEQGTQTRARRGKKAKASK
ncbi:DNA excision repair protein [Colletotrichum graminicola]|uniref:DNA excision repair protein n=1 Tax=Colletotrichum graminicola (strain M1.001 / M2 / FGSC 10212) TaxID=645133 RepID=E3Q3G8_COLGM|nr:DNA excision repair protein [Colletotrichum graminicola M1.001]EFQ25570.1 DNA excision repair protein [Colletotrichum graminicola M1.001]WDK11127.1 DNA excision repair protein [Colletotrichum graminicola]